MSVETYRSTDMQPARMDLITFAREAEQVHGLAEALSRTAFVPASMKGKPDDITACILYGREIGMPPMTALRTIHVIEGRPSLEANAMRGLAQDSGVKFQIEEQTDSRVIMHARAPGDAKWTTSTWTMDRARKMGLDGKSNWKKMPQAMLVARATSELCRLVAANVLLGMPYAVEELQDGPLDQPPPVAEEPQKKTVRRQPLRAVVQDPRPAPEPDPEPDPEPAPEPAPEPEAARAIEPRPQRPAEPINDNVRRALMAAYNGAGVTSRDERLAHVASVLGRPVESVNDVSNDEGKQIIRAINGQNWDEWVQTGATS